MRQSWNISSRLILDSHEKGMFCQVYINRIITTLANPESNTKLDSWSNVMTSWCIQGTKRGLPSKDKRTVSGYFENKVVRIAFLGRIHVRMFSSWRIILISLNRCYAEETGLQCSPRISKRLKTRYCGDLLSIIQLIEKETIRGGATEIFSEKFPYFHHINVPRICNIV